MNDDLTLPARPGLARPLAVPDLMAAVAASRSWHGVMVRLGLTTSRAGRVLHDICDELGIDYSHFRAITPDADTLRQVMGDATTWAEALNRLGYARGSGSARATVGRHCEELGIPVRLGASAQDGRDAAVAALVPRPEHLRAAGPHLVAAALTLAGCRVSWAPEGAPYDLVADLPSGTLQRVQVKTSTYRSGGAWACGLRRSVYDPSGHGGHRPSRYSPAEIDYFACVDGDRQIYLIPIAEVAARSLITLRKYDRFRLQSTESG